MEMSGQLSAPAALSPGKDPVVPIECEAGWPQSWSRHGGEENFPALAGTRTLDHLTRRSALYHCALPAPVYEISYLY
jgi:hypothetical protein